MAMSDKDRAELRAIVINGGMCDAVIEMREIARRASNSTLFKDEAEWSDIIGAFTKIYDALAEGRKIE